MQIVIDDLHFTYPSGVEALCGIDLTISSGEQIAIIGQNGSGKTTLVKHCNGLLKPTRGTVQVGGWGTTEHTVAQLAKRVGYVFQNPDEQLFTKTVEEELSFGPQNLGYPEEKTAALVEYALNLTELESERQTNPYDLSPTWRKMVSLASVIAMDTPVIIFDEPTTGQDAASISRIAHVVQTLKEKGKTVITISHDIDFCAENFDRILALKKGQVLLDGPKEEVFAEEKILAETYVDPPQITRLGQRLQLPKTVTQTDEFLRVWQESLQET